MATQKSTPALFRRIADDLTTYITTGELQPGERLPPEAELCAQYKTTRPTVREALKALIASGLVEKRRWSGYYVRVIRERTWEFTTAEDDTTAIRDPWQQHATGEGAAVEQRRIEIVPATTRVREIPPTTLADLLDIDDAEDVICRRAVHVDQTWPVELSTAATPYTLASSGPLATFRHPGDEQSPIQVFTAAGYQLTRVTDALVARVPTDAEAEQLSLPEATTVADVIRRCWFTTPKGERCLLVLHSIYRADGAVFEHDVRA